MDKEVIVELLKKFAGELDAGDVKSIESVASSLIDVNWVSLSSFANPTVIAS